MGEGQESDYKGVNNPLCQGQPQETVLRFCNFVGGVEGPSA